MAQKKKVPSVEGLFSVDEAAPTLLGSRCTSCGAYYFPRESVTCRNPSCASSELTEVPLSRTGTVWSYTNACYAPPPPFVAKDPFEPFAIAAVELEEEGLTILGQVVDGHSVDDLRIGMKMELTLDTLYEDDEHEYLTWRWRPT